MPSPNLTLEAYQRAIHNRDVDALIALYDPDVRVFDAWDVWSYQGAAAWRRIIAIWFSSLGDENIRVTFDDVQTHNSDSGLASITAIVTYASLNAQGHQLRAMPNRLSWVLRQDAGAWKIIHEHTSALVGFHDKKAIFTREKIP